MRSQLIQQHIMRKVTQCLEKNSSTIPNLATIDLPSATAATENPEASCSEATCENVFRQFIKRNLERQQPSQQLLHTIQQLIRQESSR